MTAAIARYHGSGEFYPGIPARDLSAEEVEALAVADRALVERGTLYTIEAVEPPKPMKGGEANGR